MTSIAHRSVKPRRQNIGSSPCRWVYPADPNRVQWKASADDHGQPAFIADRPLPGTGDVANSTPTSTATVDKPLTIRPDRLP